MIVHSTISSRLLGNHFRLTSSASQYCFAALETCSRVISGWRLTAYRLMDRGSLCVVPSADISSSPPVIIIIITIIIIVIIPWRRVVRTSSCNSYVKAARHKSKPLFRASKLIHTALFCAWQQVLEPRRTVWRLWIKLNKLLFSSLFRFCFNTTLQDDG